VTVWEDDRCVIVIGPLRLDVPLAAVAAAKLAATVGITDGGETVTGGLRCTHVRYVGGPRDGHLQAVDGHRRVPIGEDMRSLVLADGDAIGSYLVTDYEWHFGITYALATWLT
jgi:hypothetical protein